MKKSIVTLIALCGLLVFGGSAWSLTITPGNIDVGGVDTYLAGAALGNSGDATELAWVQNELLTLGYNNNVVMTAKTPTNDGAGWVQTNGNLNAYAFDMQGDSSDYFLIKTGNLSAPPGYNPPSTNLDTFLFKNDPNLVYAVVDLVNSIPGINLIEIEKFSHIDEFNPTSVPEPTTMLLLGLGLVGLAGVGRKFKK